MLKFTHGRRGCRACVGVRAKDAIKTGWAVCKSAFPNRAYGNVIFPDCYYVNTCRIPIFIAYLIQNPPSLFEAQSVLVSR